MAFSVSYLYKIIDHYSAPLNKITAKTKAFRGSANRASISLNNLSNKTRSMQSALGSVVGAMALIYPTKQAMDFEDAMTDVNKVVNFSSKKSFVKFKESIFKTSLALGKIPKNIAEIAIAGGKLGINEKLMEGFIDVVSRTSVAFDILESTAGQQIGSIKSKLKLTIKETSKLMDAVNSLADSTAASGSEMIQIIARTSGTLKSIQMPPNFIAGWSAFANIVEVTPQLAASGLNMMVAKMMTMPGMMKKMLKSPSETIRNFLGQFMKLDPAKRAVTAMKIFGLEAGRFVLKTLGNTELLDSILAKVGKKSTFAGSMLRELNKKLATSKTAWGRIKSVVSILSITIGDALLPAIKWIAPILVKMALSMRKFASAHPGVVKIIAGMLAITAAIGPLLMAIGFMASGLSVVAGLASSVAGVFAGGITTIVSALTAPLTIILSIAAAIALMWANSEKFRSGVQHLIKALNPLLDLFMKLMGYLLSFGKWAASGVFNAIGDIVGDLVESIARIIDVANKVVPSWLGSKSGLAGGASSDWTKGKVVQSIANKSIINKNVANKSIINKNIVNNMTKDRIPKLVIPHPSYSTNTFNMTKDKMPSLFRSTPASNTIASKGFLNGKIEVSAKGGATVNKASLDTDVPGNMGLTLASGSSGGW